MAERLPTEPPPCAGKDPDLAGLGDAWDKENRGRRRLLLHRLLMVGGLHVGLPTSEFEPRLESS